MRFAFLLACAATAAAPTAQAPPNYYASVITTTPGQLRTTLHAVIANHTKIPYTASSTDTWDVLEIADQNPGNTSQILDLYKNAVYTKQGGGNTFYNREHSWPNSLGFPNDGSTNFPYTDCHHLFLCDISYNGARDNKVYDNGASSWTEWSTLVNAGQGGGSGTFPGNSNWTNTAAWQTWGSRKGDVARAMFYMDLCYEGGASTPGGQDLRLTDNQNLIDASATGNNESIAYMGKLTALLQWHQQDPVDAKEMARNNAVYAHQGNRNPFIDHPEWVACVYANQCARIREPEVWINEVHYDNTGTDVGEFVEIAGYAGTNVNGWQLLLYDGANGHVYGAVKVSGTIPNQQAGFGVLSFPAPGLQDGADGIALVTRTGVVMHFVSYEGGFAATNGAAAGRVAADLGVSEPSTTPVGYSLQLGGTGSQYSTFVWQAAQAATPGQRNTNQTFQ